VAEKLSDGDLSGRKDVILGGLISDPRMFVKTEVRADLVFFDHRDLSV
jgi:hypothetical protein